MSIYTHKKLSLWRLGAIALRATVKLLGVWPWLLIAAFFLFPISPHLRWQYTYRELGSVRVYTACTYLGAKGFVSHMHGDHCPFVVLINRNQH